MRWSRAWRTLRKAFRRIFRRRGASGAMPMDPDMLKSLVREILSTRDDEIDCDQCLDRLDRFVELVLAGKNAAEAFPLVQDHLSRCHDCHEEFEALLTILRRRI